MTKLFSALLIAVLSIQTALAAPARVVVIRHGEKPAQGSELNERGWQRARALVAFFKHDSRITPAAIYAMAAKGEDGSVRAIQTVTPLAKDLGLDIRQAFKKKDIAQLVSEIMADKTLEGRIVLVCWEHKVIPDIIKAFGWDGGPWQWHGEVYDRAWVVDLNDGRAASFKNLPQHVLPGDSAD